MSALGVCRWELECAVDAVVVVRHTRLGEIAACEDHAEYHAQWVRKAVEAVDSGRRFIYPDGQVRDVPPDEPEPECYCPTTPRRVVQYCPRDGTREQRGVDPLAESDV